MTDAVAHAIPGSADILQQLQGEVVSWNVAHDELLLEALRGMHVEMLRRASQTEEKLSAMSRQSLSVDVGLRKALAQLEILSHYQFIENQVGEDSVEDPAAQVEPEPDDIMEGRGADPVQAIAQALSHGRQFVEQPAAAAWGPLAEIVTAEELVMGISRASSAVSSTAGSELAQEDVPVVESLPEPGEGGRQWGSSQEHSMHMLQIPQWGPYTLAKHVHLQNNLEESLIEVESTKKHMPREPEGR